MVPTSGLMKSMKKEGFVVHHVQVSLRPAEVGMDDNRSFKISDNRITLSAPPTPSATVGETRITRLTFERVK